MKPVVLVAALLVMAAATLSLRTPARAGGGGGELELFAVSSGGMLRWYRVHVPTGYDPAVPTPVVVGFHGGGGNAVQFADSTGLSGTADRHGFLAVYPEGTGVLGGWPFFLLETWNAGGCCGPAAADDVDDVGFVADMLVDLGGRYNVDHERVYATGISNGGMLSYRLAWQLPGSFAAIAPVAAALGLTSVPPSELPPAPIPIVAFHGWLDTNVPFRGGVGSGISGFDFPSQEATLAPFLLKNEAVLPTAPFEIIGDAHHYLAPSPTTGADIAYWLLFDGGHSWPGGPRPGWNPREPVSDDVDANEAMWAFFEAHPRG